MSSAAVAFRTDASLDIGSGHVMRCLALADALRERGSTCRFVCRAHAGHLIDGIRGRGHSVEVLASTSPANQTKTDAEAPAHAAWLGTGWQQDAEQTGAALADHPVDWLVVDHYALDHRWEMALRQPGRRVMVIDDLADRVHDCALLLDQNLGRAAHDYRDKVPPACKVLAGPLYALLRPEFAALRTASLARRVEPRLRHLLVTMGGVDRDDATGRVLDALTASKLPADASITVVMGARAPWVGQVRERAQAMGWHCNVEVDVRDMATLMARSDLAIGAAGSSAWERCCLGLPTLMMVLADNQRAAAAHLEQAGAAVTLPSSAELAANLRHWLGTFADNPASLMRMSQAAAAITDGLGTQRVLSAVLDS